MNAIFETNMNTYYKQKHAGYVVCFELVYAKKQHKN